MAKSRTSLLTMKGMKSLKRSLVSASRGIVKGIDATISSFEFPADAGNSDVRGRIVTNRRWDYNAIEVLACQKPFAKK